MTVTKIYADKDAALTCFAGAAVVGARFVMDMASATPTVNGNKPTVQHATAGGWATGVSVADQATVGGDVEVYTDGIVGVTASGAITAGQRVSCGAAGVAVAQSSTNPSFGVATATVADGALCPVRLQGL